MRIRRKIGLTIVVVSVLIITITAFFGFGLLLPSFNALEEQETYKRVIQLNNTIQNELSNLDGTSYDWAYWDDTYYFVQNTNSEYIEQNLLDSTFITLKLNFLIFIDTSGQLVYAKDYDYRGNQELPLLEKVSQEILLTPKLWNFSDKYDKIVSAITLADEPAIIASKYILTSQSQGPIAGTLIIGRYLNENAASFYSDTLGLPVKILSNSNEIIESELINQNSFSEELSIVVKPVDDKYIAGYMLVKDFNSNPVAVMQLTNTRYIYAQGVATVNFYMLLSLIVWIIFGILFMGVMEKGIVLPIHKLTTSVKEMTIANSDMPKSVFGGDETTLLTEAVKDTLTQKLSAIEELSGMVGHDLRNPLQSITGATYYIKTKYSANMDQTGKEILRIIEDSVAYSNKIISDLLEYSRSINLELSETTPKNIINNSLPFIKIPSNITVIDRSENYPTFTVDITKMQRVFLNIITNALDAMPQGGTLTIESKQSKQEIIFVVKDTGLGISKAAMKNIWTPLFTTKAKGMGFGLSISKRLVEAHGGTIILESQEGKGTKITIKLPLNRKKQ